MGNSRNTEKNIWRINKLIFSLLVFLLLVGMLLGGGYVLYNFTTKNQRCSHELMGCDKYGFDEECNVVGYKFHDRNVPNGEKFYFTPWDHYGNTEYDLKNRNVDGKAQWFCNASEAETEGYGTLDGYLRNRGIID